MTSVYNNIDNSISSTGTNVNVGLFNSFTPSVSGTISDIQLILSNMVTSGISTFTVGLYENNPSKPYPCPGELISTLLIIPDLAIPESFAVIYDFGSMLITNPFISATTRYWVGISGIDSSVQWNFTRAITGTGVGGEFFNMGGITFSDKKGAYQMIIQV